MKIVRNCREFVRISLTNEIYKAIMCGIAIRKHVDETSTLWNVPERGSKVEVPYREAAENYL